jgi:hypothetical protein
MNELSQCSEHGGREIDINSIPRARSFETRCAISILGPAILGILITCACFYPGYLNFDSQWQLAQARANSYDDFHPPLMAWVWRYLDRLIPGPGGFFLFHVSLLWLGLSLFVYYAIEKRRWGWLVCLGIGLCPPFFLRYGMVVKDTAMTSALIFACGSLLAAEKTKRLLPLALCLPALFYACGVRFNAVTAVFPICIWWGACFSQNTGIGKSSAGLKILFGACLLLAVSSSVVLFERIVIKPKRNHQMAGIMVYDLVGISLEKGVNLLPNFLNQRQPEPLNLDDLRRNFHVENNFWLMWGDYKNRRPGFPYTDQENSTLTHSWLSTIKQNPSTYLLVRWRFFQAFLGLSQRPIELYWLANPDSPEAEAMPRWNAPFRNQVLIYRSKLQDSSVLFRAWLYIVLLGLLSIMACFFKLKSPVGFTALIASAFLYLAPYFFVGPMVDFRYVWWVVDVVSLSICLVDFTVTTRGRPAKGLDTALCASALPQ